MKKTVKCFIRQVYLLPVEIEIEDEKEIRQKIDNDEYMVTGPAYFSGECELDTNGQICYQRED